MSQVTGFSVGGGYLPAVGAAGTRENVIYFVLCLLNHPKSLKNLKFSVHIIFIEILTPRDSDITPKVMPPVFYLDLRSFIFY